MKIICFDRTGKVLNYAEEMQVKEMAQLQKRKPDLHYVSEDSVIIEDGYVTGKVPLEAKSENKVPMPPTVDASKAPEVLDVLPEASVAQESIPIIPPVALSPEEKSQKIAEQTDEAFGLVNRHYYQKYGNKEQEKRNQKNRLVSGIIDEIKSDPTIDDITSDYKYSSSSTLNDYETDMLIDELNVPAGSFPIKPEVNGTSSPKKKYSMPKKDIVEQYNKAIDTFTSKSYDIDYAINASFGVNSQIKRPHKTKKLSKNEAIAIASGLALGIAIIGVTHIAMKQIENHSYAHQKEVYEQQVKMPVNLVSKNYVEVKEAKDAFGQEVKWLDTRNLAKDIISYGDEAFDVMLYNAYRNMDSAPNASEIDWDDVIRMITAQANEEEHPLIYAKTVNCHNFNEYLIQNGYIKNDMTPDTEAFEKDGVKKLNDYFHSIMSEAQAEDLELNGEPFKGGR